MNAIDRLPRLKIIVGQWGELLPCYFDRMNDALTRGSPGRKRNAVNEYKFK